MIVNNPSPRILDDRWYHGQIRRNILNPLTSRVVRKVEAARSAGQWADNLDEEFDEWRQENPAVAENLAEEAVPRFAAYQKQKFISRYSRAFGINVNPLMPDATISPMLRARLRSNVDLITSIPDQMQERMQQKFAQIYAEKGFDQQAVKQMLTDEFGIANRRARLIARDQNNKTIGELNAARSRQLGIEKYTWRTSEDERVRPSHAILDGTEQRWDMPPSEGHPGSAVSCRCSSLSIV